jgi:orotate phosphoribosyltransferase
MTLKERAIEFFLAEQVLKFGDFTLKSGRKSPYFFNTGSLCSATQLATMGELYAEKLRDLTEFDDADVVFGSAYKGIPIAVTTTIALKKDRPMLRSVSDRKEAKTHGDASAFLGVIKAGDKVVIVDDVITDGATKIEALEKLKNAGAIPLGFIIAFDRAEPGKDGSGRTAKQSFEEQTGLPVCPLIDVNDIAEVKADFKEVLAGYMASFAG